jgi:hypothetical protein
MKHYPAPTRADQEDFLIRLYFGPGDNDLRLCIDRAYLDFNRTLHGISKLPYIREPATATVERAFRSLCGDASISTQDAFDHWHRHTCMRLCLLYTQHRFDDFHIGQAQKWLNMTLKYIYTFGERRLPGYAHLYPFGHVPLDNIMLGQLSSLPKCPQLSTSWSRIQNYDEYLQFQRWVRTTFAGSSPLAVEFHMWQEDVTQPSGNEG